MKINCHFESVEHIFYKLPLYIAHTPSLKSQNMQLSIFGIPTLSPYTKFVRN